MATLAAQLGTVAGSRQGPAARKLKMAGVLAGPFYVVVALAQALTRPGFDLRRHDISLLADGSLGWIQIANFLISGLLVVAAARGLAQLPSDGRGRIWGPRLIGIYGVCVAMAGIFVADPMGGFPPGAATSSTMSWHGGLHLLCAAVGFLALISACFVFACRFLTEGRAGWGAYSLITGIAFFVTFFGSVFMSTAPSTARLGVLGLWVAVLLGWSWLSVISAKGVRA